MTIMGLEHRVRMYQASGLWLSQIFVHRGGWLVTELYKADRVEDDQVVYSYWGCEAQPDWLGEGSLARGFALAWDEPMPDYLVVSAPSRQRPDAEVEWRVVSPRRLAEIREEELHG